MSSAATRGESAINGYSSTFGTFSHYLAPSHVGIEERAARAQGTTIPPLHNQGRVNNTRVSALLPIAFLTTNPIEGAK
jgi:hypothetical protein